MVDDDPPTCEEIAALNTADESTLTTADKKSIMRHMNGCGPCWRRFLDWIPKGREVPGENPDADPCELDLPAPIPL